MDDPSDIKLFAQYVSRIGFRKVPEDRYSYFSAEESDFDFFDGSTKTLHFRIYAGCSLSLGTDHDFRYVSSYVNKIFSDIVIRRYKITHK